MYIVCNLFPVDGILVLHVSEKYEVFLILYVANKEKYPHIYCVVFGKSAV